MLDAKYQINHLAGVSAGVSFHYLTNGALKNPNYGLSATFINIGFSLRPFRSNKYIAERFYAPTKPYDAILRRFMEINLGVLFGYKNMQSIYGNNYIVYHAFTNAFLNISKNIKVGLGFDFSYDASPTKISNDKGIYEFPEIGFRPGINGAYQQILSRLSFVLNFGVYLVNPPNSEGTFYQKYALQYTFTKDFFATMMFKFHWNIPAYIGWGLGYKFNIQYGKKILK